MNRRTGVGNLLSGVLSGLIANKQLARQRGFEADERARRDAADAWMREQQGMTREDREIAKSDRQRSITRQTEADEWSRKDRAWAEAERKRKQEIEDAELENILLRADEQAVMQLLGVFPQAAPKIFSEAAKFRGAQRIPGRPSPTVNVPVPTIAPSSDPSWLDIPNKPKLDLGKFISGLGPTAYQLKDEAEKRDYRTKAIGAISEMIKDREKARFDRRSWYLLKDPSLSREQIDVAVDTELPSWNYDDLLGRFGLTADDVMSRMNTLTAPVGSPVSSPVPMGQGALELPPVPRIRQQFSGVGDTGVFGEGDLPDLSRLRELFGGGGFFGAAPQEALPSAPSVQASAGRQQSQGPVQAPPQGVIFNPGGKAESTDTDPVTRIRELVRNSPKSNATPAQRNSWMQEMLAMQRAATSLRRDSDDDAKKSGRKYTPLSDVVGRIAGLTNVSREVADGFLKQVHPDERGNITPEHLLRMRKVFAEASPSAQRWLPGTPANSLATAQAQLKAAEAALANARKAAADGFGVEKKKAEASLEQLERDRDHYRGIVSRFANIKPPPKLPPPPPPRPAPVAPAWPPEGNKPLGELSAIGRDLFGGPAPRPAPTAKPKAAPKPAPKATVKAVTVDQARAELKKRYPNATPEQIEAVINRAKANAASRGR